MNRLISICVGILLISMVSAVPVVVESGDLQAHIEAIVIPAADSSDKYMLPNDTQRGAFREAIRHILDGDLQAAADAAVNANYDVVEYTDNVSSDLYALLREKNSNQHWGGFYAFDLTPERTLVIQNPHALYDGVRTAATDLFFETDAVAFLQAGTHRNNSPTESDCDGDLGGDPYRISDMAHAPDSLFQDAHEEIEDYFTRTVSLNFHGMADSTDPADVVISNGTPRVYLGNSLSRDLASRMNEILGAAMDLREAVSHQEPGEDPALSGSNNTQGRYTNGSSDLCMADAPRAIFPERFIHMECDPDVRDGNSSNWAFVIQALNELIPLFSDPEPDLPTGEITITEMMANPDQVGDGTGEYLELFNHTDSPIDMSGWTIFDRSENVASFSGVIQPGQLFVVGVSGDLNGGEVGGVPDAIWTDTIGDMTLTNSSDIITILDDNGDLVASIAYEDGSFFGVGVSHEINTGNAYPNGQTVGTDYVGSTTPFGADFGSPDTRGSTDFPLLLPAVQATISGDQTELSLLFPSQAAVTYALWESDNLGGWIKSPGVAAIIGNGSDGEFIIPKEMVDKKFYRLEFDYPAAE